MIKHIDRIRSQPQHIRELWVIGLTIVTVLIVLAIWFRSFNNNIYSLLNPGQAPAADQNVAAANSGDTPGSLFGYIGQAIQDGKAEISGLLNLNAAVSTTQPAGNGVPSLTDDSVHALPLSGNR